MTKKQSPEFQHNRKIILDGEPLCHWCRRNPATEADHLIESDRGGDDTLENLVASCKSCNGKRGAFYVNRKTAARIQQRNTLGKNETRTKAEPFFETEPRLTPTPSLPYLLS